MDTRGHHNGEPQVYRTLCTPQGLNLPRLRPARCYGYYEKDILHKFGPLHHLLAHQMGSSRTLLLVAVAALAATCSASLVKLTVPSDQDTSFAAVSTFLELEFLSLDLKK
jgi:hypothetical protein